MTLEVTRLSGADRWYLIDNGQGDCSGMGEKDLRAWLFELGARRPHDCRHPWAESV